jgi:hypothetical protein
MNASHVNAAQLAALSATTCPPPARLLYRPAAGPRQRWELHIPSGGVHTYPKATAARAALAALTPGAALLMSPEAIAAETIEAGWCATLEHLGEAEPQPWLLSPGDGAGPIRFASLVGLSAYMIDRHPGQDLTLTASALMALAISGPRLPDFPLALYRHSSRKGR